MCNSVTAAIIIVIRIEGIWIEKKYKGRDVPKIAETETIEGVSGKPYFGNLYALQKFEPEGSF